MLEEGFFKGENLTVEQETGQDYESQDHVGANSGIRMLNAPSKSFAARAGNPIELSQSTNIRVVFGPRFQTAAAQKIAVILQQFFLTGPSDIRQLQFQFLRGSGNLAAFNYVLFS